MATLSLVVTPAVSPSELSPVKAIVTAINDNGSAMINTPIMLNVDGTNTPIGITNAHGVIDYTQSYSTGIHRVYAWHGEHVSPVMTLQVNELPPLQEVCYVSITETSGKTQCSVGEKLRFRVDVTDGERRPYMGPDTVYLAFNAEMVDSNVTKNGSAFFDVVFNEEGKNKVYAYDSNSQSDIWYMEVNPQSAQSPTTQYKSNEDNFETGTNPVLVHQPAVDIVTQFFNWLGGKR